MWSMVTINSIESECKYIVGQPHCPLRLFSICSASPLSVEYILDFIKLSCLLLSLLAGRGRGLHNIDFLGVGLCMFGCLLPILSKTQETMVQLAQL